VLLCLRQSEITMGKTYASYFISRQV